MHVLNARNPLTFFITLLVAVLATTTVIACGGNDDDSDDNGNGDPTATSAPAGDNGSDDDADDDDNGDSGNGGDSAGTITIGDESWTLVPSIQCAIFGGGSVVSIAGHAAEDETIEIVIDYDPDNDFVSARVSGGPDDIHWTSEDDALDIGVDGDTVSGSGTFMAFIGGETAEGSFEVNC